MAEEIGASLRVTEHAAGARAGCGMFDVRTCGAAYGATPDRARTP